MENEKTSQERRRQIAATFTKKIGQRQAMRIRGQKQKDRIVWFGLGMFGVVGWSVAIPTLIGIALGLWIDQNLPSRFSWTLMLLIAGVTAGCMNAWYWVKRGGYNIEHLKGETDEEETHEKRR